MSTKTRLWRACTLLALLALLISPLAATARAVAPPKFSETQSVKAQVAAPDQAVRAVRHDVSPALRDITPRLPDETALRKAHETATRMLPRRVAEGPQPTRLDPVVQDRPGQGKMPAADFNFEGLSNEDNRSTIGFLVAPPDTDGAIGPDHYIQWVNLVFAIYEVDRATTTATMVYGPAAGNSLWAGFGGICETHNDGDIIVLYDRMADRWFMSQFGIFAEDGDWHQCVAVSASSDPLGEWYRYDFVASETKLNDYPKFGVWPDAYYMTANQFSENTFDWAGQGVWALERDQMLLGLDARMVYFDLYDQDPNLGGMLPADLDGNLPPPVGTPNYFVTFDDDAFGAAQDQLQVWAFHVDWTIPANSTFTHLADLATEPFDSAVCTAFRGACIDQPNGNKLEDLADRLMYRLAYRNYGDHQAMAVNHTVDVLADSSDSGQAGVRWYELRDTGGGWSIYQQGTYAPDGDHRWMGSLAMDAVGNLAVGYSVSSTETYPSIRYTGRLAGDPLNTLGQGEQELVAGSESQYGTARWGDYSAMTIDPLDDCTFWYTQEYVSGLNAENFGNWFTRIGSFRYPTCTAGPAGNLQGTVTAAVGGAPVPNASLDLGNGIMTVTDENGFYQILNVPAGTFDVTAWAYGYLQQTASGVTITDGATATQDFALDAAPVATISGTVSDAGHGWPLYASIYISTMGFETTLFTDPLTGAYSIDLLQDTPYYFEVEATVAGYLLGQRKVTPPAGGSTEDFTLEPNPANCVAPGYELQLSFSSTEDFEAGDGGYIASGVTTWNWGTITYGPPGAHSGEKGWATNPLGSYSDNENGETTSPPADLSGLPGGVAVSWWQWFQSENGFDYGSVQVTRDGGATWDTVYGPVTGDVDLDWTEYTVVLDPSFAVSDFQVRFRFWSDGSVTMPGFYVDDVSLGAADCVALSGGLLVGNVFDLNTGAGVVGASVISDDNPDDSTTTNATPDDPNVEDGFYALFSSLIGLHTFTATAPDFGSDTQEVFVVQNDLVSQDFSLPAGIVTAAPTEIEATLDMGETASDSFTLTNNGGVTAAFELTERDKGREPANRQGAPIQHRSGHFTPHRLDAGPKSAAAPEKPIPIHAPPWMDVASYPTAIMDNAADALDGLVYSVGGFDSGSNVNAAYVYDPASDSWSQVASMANIREKPAAAFVEGLLYVIGGWSDFGEPVTALEIYDPATDSWSQGASPPAAYAASTAVGMDGQLYVIGGCGSFMCGVTDVYRYDPAADSWSSLAPYPEETSWLACGPIDGMIYCAGGVSDSLGESQHTYVYDTGTNSWTPLADMPQTQWGMGFVAANGLLYISGGVTDNFSTVTNETFVYDPALDAWNPDANSNNIVYRGGSACGFYKIGGSIGGFSPIPNTELYPGLDECGAGADVPWLSENPVEGTLDADGGSQIVDVTLDAGVPEVDQPGTYKAQVRVKTDTPYEVEPVQVTMVVNPPASWGKLAGVVTGLEYCDEPGLPLAGATVEVEGVTSLRSDSNGAYAWWLENGTYMLTVSARSFVSQSVEVTVAPGETATTDFALRLDAPCVDRSPASFEKTVPEGGSDMDTLTVENSGAGELSYQILETTLSFDLPAPAAPAGDPAAFRLPSTSGPASVLSLDAAAAPLGQAPATPESGWFGGFDLPGGVVHYASAQCYEQPDSFYVISGVDGTFSVSDKTWRYDAAANEWVELASVPAGQEGPTAVCYFGKIYVMGGGGTDQFYIYDIASDTWSAGPPLPRGSAGGAAGAWDGKVLYIGGDNDFYPESGVSDEVNVYDIASGTWEANGASMPVGTSFPGFVQAGPYVYVVGGWGIEAPTANVTATMRYNMENNSWQSGPDFTSARADFALAVTNQALYAMGGDKDGGFFFDPSDLFERLDLSAWPGGAWEDTEDPMPIQVTANNAGFCAESISGPAVWSVGGGNLNIGVIYGATLFNAAEGETCYSIYSDVTWLSQDPQEGLVPHDASQPVAVRFDAAGLARGTYQATLVLVTNDPVRSLLTVPVEMTVGEPIEAQYRLWLPIVLINARLGTPPE